MKRLRYHGVYYKDVSLIQCWTSIHAIHHIHKPKKKSHIMLTNEEKAFDRNCMKFMTKTPRKIGIEGNLIKNICRNL